MFNLNQPLTRNRPLWLITKFKLVSYKAVIGALFPDELIVGAAFTDSPIFYKSIFNTLYYTVCRVPLVLIGSLPRGTPAFRNARSRRSQVAIRPLVAGT
mgnify:CR=1 FL=1